MACRYRRRPSPLRILPYRPPCRRPSRPRLDGYIGSDRLEYSGWWLRVAAALLDGLIIGAPLVALTTVLLVAGHGNGPGASCACCLGAWLSSPITSRR